MEIAPKMTHIQASFKKDARHIWVKQHVETKEIPLLSDTDPVNYIKWLMAMYSRLKPGTPGGRRFLFLADRESRAPRRRWECSGLQHRLRS